MRCAIGWGHAGGCGILFERTDHCYEPCVAEVRVAGGLYTLNSELSEGDAAADPTVIDVDVDGPLLDILSMVSGAVDARVDVGLLGVDIGWSGTAASVCVYSANPPARRPDGNVRASLTNVLARPAEIG
jgi:hypothetical protein